MTTIYFEVKNNCALYKDYFEFIDNLTKIKNTFKQLRKEFGIETSNFYLVPTKLHICPTEHDMEKFKEQLKKNSIGEFKKNSPASARWRELTKDFGIFAKPRIFWYMKITGNIKERLFHSGNKLYCSVESTGLCDMPKWGIKMKASEFYKVLEDLEESAE